MHPLWTALRCLCSFECGFEVTSHLSLSSTLEGQKKREIAFLPHLEKVWCTLKCFFFSSRKNRTVAINSSRYWEERDCWRAIQIISIWSPYLNHSYGRLYGDCHELTTERRSSPLPEQMCYVRITSFHSHQRRKSRKHYSIISTTKISKTSQENEVIKINTVLLKLYIYVLLPITKCLRKYS